MSQQAETKFDEADVKTTIAQKNQRLIREYQKGMQELEEMETNENSLLNITTGDCYEEKHEKKEDRAIEREIKLQVSKAFNAMEDEARLKEQVQRKYRGYIEKRVKEIIMDEVQGLMYREKMQSVPDHRSRYPSRNPYASRGGRNKQYRDEYYKLPKYPKRAVDQHQCIGHEPKNKTYLY